MGLLTAWLKPTKVVNIVAVRTNMGEVYNSTQALVKLGAKGWKHALYKVSGCGLDFIFVSDQELTLTEAMVKELEVAVSTISDKSSTLVFKEAKGLTHVHVANYQPA